MRDDLRSLAIRYVIDKEITYGHNYIPGYVDLFESRRKHVRNFLEIGIGLGEHYDSWISQFPSHTIGGSLKMWMDYFPYAHIYGMDIYECHINEPRITTVVGDQSSEADLMQMVKMMGGEIDIVVDDGSHFVHHQIFSFMVLARFVAPGGVYVIEDVKSHTIDGFKDLSIFPPEFQTYIRKHFHMKWYDTREDTKLADDFLMVFTRKSE